jgi:LemA protein
MWIAIAIAGAVLIAAVWIFNRMIGLKVRAAGAWSDIDVQLKRRSDLVPPLVETVRGYAKHEATTFEQAAAARSQAQAASTTGERGAAESQVGRHITQIIALAEAYPELKADSIFRSLHTNLVEVEDHIQSARRYYNAVVRDYNTMLRQFPQSLVAGVIGLKPREFFELDSAGEAAAPAVELKER